MKAAKVPAARRAAAKPRARALAKPAARKKPATRKKSAKVEPTVGEQPEKPDGDRKRMTMVERVRLAERMTEARNKKKPDTWEAISKREGVPLRTCKYIYAQYHDEISKLGDATGGRVLNETLILYGASIETLAWLSEFGETGAVRVGAVRSLLDAAKGRIELLAVMGRMPRSFRAVDELALLSLLVRRMAEVIERRGLEPEIVAEFLGLLDEVQPVIEGRATIAELPALMAAS